MLKLLLIQLSERYASARGLSISRVSTLVFADGKVLTRISKGGDLTTGRFEAAISWFSANWPEGAAWPAEIDRPVSIVNSPAIASAGDDAGVFVAPPAQQGAPATNFKSPDYLPSGEAGAQRPATGCAPATNSDSAVAQ